MVSAHTIVCVYVLCTHYVCVPRPSADSAVCVQARNRICSKINLCICSSVYKFNIDELLLKLLAKKGSLTYFMLELGGMTKNLYHGIFLNYTGFTVYDGIHFFHA